MLPIRCCLRIGLRCTVNCCNISTAEGQVISWASEVRYLGVFVVRSRSFICAYDNAKRSFYSAVNGILGKVLNFASEDVILQLIVGKCMTILLYGLDACPVNKTDMRSLDFTVDRVFMKLFKTGNIEIVRECQAFFGFKLPSVDEVQTLQDIMSNAYRPLTIATQPCSRDVVDISCLARRHRMRCYNLSFVCPFHLNRSSYSVCRTLQASIHYFVTLTLTGSSTSWQETGVIFIDSQPLFRPVLRTWMPCTHSSRHSLKGMAAWPETGTVVPVAGTSFWSVCHPLKTFTNPHSSCHIGSYSRLYVAVQRQNAWVAAVTWRLWRAS